MRDVVRAHFRLIKVHPSRKSRDLPRFPCTFVSWLFFSSVLRLICFFTWYFFLFFLFRQVFSLLDGGRFQLP